MDGELGFKQIMLEVLVMSHVRATFDRGLCSVAGSS